MSWYPRVICFAEYREDAKIYFCPQEKLVIAGEVELQKELLHACTGERSAQEILKALAPDFGDENVEAMLFALKDANVVVDAVSQMWRGYHSFTCNPLPFGKLLSQDEIEELVWQRRASADSQEETIRINERSNTVQKNLKMPLATYSFSLCSWPLCVVWMLRMCS